MKKIANARWFMLYTSYKTSQDTLCYRKKTYYPHLLDTDPLGFVYDETVVLVKYN